jgi:hypothetical protein
MFFRLWVRAPRTRIVGVSTPRSGASAPGAPPMSLTGSGAAWGSSEAADIGSGKPNMIASHALSSGAARKSRLA